MAEIETAELPKELPATDTGITKLPNKLPMTEIETAKLPQM